MLTVRPPDPSLSRHSSLPEGLAHPGGEAVSLGGQCQDWPYFAFDDRRSQIKGVEAAEVSPQWPEMWAAAWRRLPGCALAYPGADRWHQVASGEGSCVRASASFLRPGKSPRARGRLPAEQ